MSERGLLMRLLCLMVTLALVASAAQAITINIIYDDDMQHSNSTGTFGLTEKAVISQAVTQWQNAITTAGVVNITMLKNALAGNLLGWASNYQTNAGDTDVDGRLNGTPVSGQVEIDDRVGDIGQFFVDNTPGEHSEFAPGNTPYHFINGPANQYDMLSTVKHEIAHVLGFSQSFDNFFDKLAPSPLAAEQLRWLYAFAGPPTLGPPAQYLPGAIFTNGGVYMREWEDPVSGPGPVPSHVDWYTAPGGSPLAPPATGVGNLAGFFPDDLLNPATGFGVRKIESDMDLDILADAFGYTVVPEPATMALLAIGALVLTRRRRT